MTTISEAEFARICAGIVEDRDSIIKHNPIGPDDEILLWMLLSCLIVYLNLTEMETPCFTGKPSAQTYRDAILFLVNERRADKFDPDLLLTELVRTVSVPDR
jgi:hypothetical protein